MCILHRNPVKSKQSVVIIIIQWNPSCDTTSLDIKNMVPQDRWSLVTGSFTNWNVQSLARDMWSFKTGFTVQLH